MDEPTQKQDQVSEVPAIIDSVVESPVIIIVLLVFALSILACGFLIAGLPIS